jgi:hypothetical protein
MPLKRPRHELHWLTDDGMVACNPRDREAANRAEVERIATEDPRAVTCRKCRAVMRAGRSRKADRSGDEPRSG